MSKHKLRASETILSDDTPVHADYIYIADNVFVRCPLFDSTVGEWKGRYGLKEIRRCDMFDHGDAKLGDKVEK